MRLYHRCKNAALTVAATSLLMLWISSSAIAQNSFSRERLADALSREDLPAVRGQVESAVIALKEKAGFPDVPETFIAIPKDARWLTAEEAHVALKPLNQHIEKKLWWKIGLDPAHLAHTLREPASVVLGCAFAFPAKLEDRERSLTLAKDAAEFLMWAQKQGGSGCFPFPSIQVATGDNALVSGGKYLERAKREGRLEQVVHNGWCIDDTGDGGLQFDNGQVGTALFEFYQVTQDRRYLDSAVAAADWAMKRPMVPNWNYNSFSVLLLSKAFEVTGDPKYFAAAQKKAIIGVIPGQLTQGPNAGRWIDGHNARPVYHYIMLRSLAALVAVMPKDNPDRPEIIESLRLGLIARNKDLLVQGASNKDYLMETLIRVNRAFADDPAFLKETHSAESLQLLGGLVSEQFRKTGTPLSPNAWGMFLSWVSIDRVRSGS